MNWLLWLIWIIWMAGSLLAMANAILYARFRRNQDQRWLSSDLEADQASVCWIISMKGIDPDLTTPFFESLLTQDYPHYRLIFTFESDQDEGYRWIRDRLQLETGKEEWHSAIDTGPRSILLINAGPSEDCGQKVHNQLAAMSRLTDSDGIVAFSDADLVCRPNTLSGLVAPINLGHFDAMSTYRWLIPKDSHPATLFASVINASCASMGGHVYLNTLWGGMMALRRSAFEELEVPRNFSRVLSDDLKLNSLVKGSGRKVGFVRSLIVPSPIQFSWSTLFEFGMRQYFMVKFYSIKLYLSAYEVTGFYLAGFITSILAITLWDTPAGWIPLATVTLSDQVRAIYRRKIYRHLFKDAPETLKSLDRTAWIEHLATPFWMAIQLIFVIGVLFRNEITWAGIRYRVQAGGATTVLSRED